MILCGAGDTVDEKGKAEGVLVSQRFHLGGKFSTSKNFLIAHLRHIFSSFLQTLIIYYTRLEKSLGILLKTPTIVISHLLKRNDLPQGYRYLGTHHDHDNGGSQSSPYSFTDILADRFPDSDGPSS
jgi:hypothetical protein